MQSENEGGVSASPSVMMMREKAEKLRAEIEATNKELTHTKYVPPKPSSSPLSGLSKSVLIRTDVDILSELSFVKRENEMLHSEIEKLNNEIEKLKRDEQRRIESYARREDSFVKEIDSLRAQLQQRNLDQNSTAPTESYLYHQQRRILTIIDEFQLRESSLEAELEGRRIELFKARLAAVRIEIEAREQTGMATLVANQRIDNLAKQLNWIKNEALELSMRNQRLVKENKELKMGKIMNLGALATPQKDKSQKVQRTNSPTHIPSKTKKSSHDNMLLFEPSEKVKKSHSQLDFLLAENLTKDIVHKPTDIEESFGEESNLDNLIQNFYEGLKKVEEVLQVDPPVNQENVNSNNNYAKNINIDSSSHNNTQTTTLNSENVNSNSSNNNNIDNLKTEIPNTVTSPIRQISSVSVNSKFIKAMEFSKKARLKTPEKTRDSNSTQNKNTTQQPKHVTTTTTTSTTSNNYSSPKSEKIVEDDYLSTDIASEMLRSLPSTKPLKEHIKRAPSSASRIRSNSEWPWLTKRPSSAAQGTSSSFFITSPPSTSSLTRPQTATSKHNLEESVDKYLWTKRK